MANSQHDAGARSLCAYRLTRIGWQVTATSYQQGFLPLGGADACKNTAVDVHFYNQLKNLKTEEYHVAYGNCHSSQCKQPTAFCVTENGDICGVANFRNQDTNHTIPGQTEYNMQIRTNETDLNMVYYNMAPDATGHSLERDLNLGCEGNKSSCKWSSLLRCWAPFECFRFESLC